MPAARDAQRAPRVFYCRECGSSAKDDARVTPEPPVAQRVAHNIYFRYDALMLFLSAAITRPPPC